MSDTCTLYGTIVFDCDEQFIENRAKGIALTISEAGYAVDMLDYLKSESDGKNMYRLLVAIPFDLYEDEDPDIVANEIVKDIVGETGLIVFLDEVLCG